MVSATRFSRSIVTLTVLALLSVAVGCGLGQDPRQAAAEEARQYLRAQTSNLGFLQFEMTVSGWTNDPVALELLAQGLESSRQGVRDASIAALEKRGDEAAVETLNAALASSIGVTRLKVAQALARLGRADGRDILVDQFLAAEGKKNPDTAARAIGALAALDPDAARPFAEERIKESADDRTALYPVLAEIGTPWARELVVKHMGRDSGQTLALAIQALGSFADQADAKRLMDYADKSATAQPALYALGHLGGDKVTGYLQKAYTREKNPVYKLYAACALWRIGERDAVRDEIASIAHAEEPERKAFQKELATALDGIEDGETTEVLIAIYKAVDDADKPVVLDVLKHHEGPQVVELLRAVLEQRSVGKTMSDYFLATSAIETLVRLDAGEELFATLSAIRANPDVIPYTRIGAAAGEVTLANALAPPG